MDGLLVHSVRGLLLTLAHPSPLRGSAGKAAWCTARGTRSFFLIPALGLWWCALGPHRRQFAPLGAVLIATAAIQGTIGGVNSSSQSGCTTSPIGPRRDRGAWIPSRTSLAAV